MNQDSPFDKYWIGFLVGLILPALFAYAYLVRFGLWDPMFNSITANYIGPQLYNTLGKVFLVSVFPNLGFVFVLYKMDWWKTAKGLMVAAMPYFVASIFLMA